MDLETFRQYCLSKPGVEESYPFKGEAVWMKVGGKLFGMANVTEMRMDGEFVPPFHFMNLKCDPEKAAALREQFPAIQPGWHQDKKHWNTLFMDGSLADALILELIDHACGLVFSNLPEKLKNAISNEKL
ncbi:MAG: MmcQ/YjbR family DNA-binding protein [Lewinellaceae bacterium]|nr:MmcQ/YjbR family DNA-binding protein [Lewinella sp.]MCB9279909.1 MmcQ/YjbR family DNA-binding protein [Lewinellaceae bacterium]